MPTGVPIALRKMIPVVLSLLPPLLFVVGLLGLSALLLRALPPRRRPREVKLQGEAARYFR
jgi:hypothetical protein